MVYQLQRKLLAGMKRLLSQTTIPLTGLIGPGIVYSILSFSLPGISSINPIRIENTKSTRKLISADHFDKSGLRFFR